ncbi:MAG TPA: hypothetical protein PKN86_10870 [Candidatus Obscuribacter sp.]|nr:hypothetical protein [Candidatus Obscuribacter sp.]MBK9280367.1 hypothetical protein [Candidatus Obscuribacter sp.]MBL8083338.1 hypothetical protein [Candidatus Obscuribacter sp.]HMY54222.1 hypothetical protein [Candidatus Obscuribacter sp.]HNA75068.1 hypothetical protein [Candidatus Obscuribacter sp.]
MAENQNQNTDPKPVVLTKIAPTTNQPADQTAGRLEINPEPVETRITVNVGVQGKMRKVLLPSGSTVADALRAAEFDAKDHEIRMGGAPARLDTPVEDGRTIMLLRPVRGNN